jgi:hypothetical protein
MISAVVYFLLGCIISDFIRALVERVKEQIIIRKILKNFKKELEKRELNNG